MTSKLVISALGTDQPGIVDKISNFIYQHDLNIEDSRMTVLGGEFAVLLLVSGNEDSLNSFQAQAAEMEQTLNMSLLIKATSDTGSDINAVPYTVEVTSLDHPGIVGNIASFFSSRNLNIVNLHTERYAAPHTGSPMFSLHMTVGISAGINISNLRQEFMQTCDDLNLDAELSIL